MHLRRSALLGLASSDHCLGIFGRTDVLTKVSCADAALRTGRFNPWLAHSSRMLSRMASASLIYRQTISRLINLRQSLLYRLLLDLSQRALHLALSTDFDLASVATTRRVSRPHRVVSILLLLLLKMSEAVNTLSRFAPLQLLQALLSLSDRIGALRLDPNL